MTTQIDYWRQPMTEALARQTIGNECFEYAVLQGSGYCASRASGAWEANDADSFGAFKAAEHAAIFRTTRHLGFRPEKNEGSVVIRIPALAFTGKGQVRQEADEIRLHSHAEAESFLAEQ